VDLSGIRTDPFIWHGLQQNAVDNAIDGKSVFSPAYGAKENILSSDNMLVK